MKPEPQNMKVEDEEDLLYGESGSSFKMKNVSSFPWEFRKASFVIFEFSPKTFDQFGILVGRSCDTIEYQEIRLVETANSTEKADILVVCDP